MPMTEEFSAIILSGGLNTRMQGLNKGFLCLQGQSFLQRLLDVLQPLFPEIILVTRQPELYQSLGVRVVTDIFQVRSALTGIHAGLLHASCKQAFVTACDTPLLQSDLIRTLLKNWDQGCQALVPRKGHFYEPLCAVYSRQCLPWIEELLQNARIKTSNLYSLVRVKEIPEHILSAADPELLSFFNINSKQDLHRLKDLLQDKNLLDKGLSLAPIQPDQDWLHK